MLAILALLLLLWLFGPGRVASAEGDEADDDELVRLAQSGDRHAFNRLVGRYQRPMYNVAYRIMGDGERAADATQDAFLAAYRKLGQYTGGSFRAWMARIVTNQCYDQIRYQKRRPAASLEALLLAPNSPPPALTRQRADEPDESLLRDEVAAWLQEVIMQLAVEQRTTLVLADVHGYSYEEIAAITEVELGTVKSRLARARRKVREMLQEQAELLPAHYRL